MPIPAGGELRNVWGEVHVISTTNLDRDSACQFSVVGELIPDVNTSGGIAVDTLFDEQVPKDVLLSVSAGSAEVDILPETADAGPFEEPGEPDFNQIFNVVNTTKKIYAREKLMTVASQGLPEFVVSSETDLWMPTDFFKIRIKRRYRVQDQTYLMFAISNPTWDRVTTGNEETLQSGEKNILQNLSVAMDLALPEVLGLTETGAESPFGDVASVIAEMVEPIVEEETAGLLANPTYNVYTRFTYEIMLNPQGRNGPISG